VTHRDYFAEIAARRSRLRNAFGGRWVQLGPRLTRLDALRSQLQHPEHTNAELVAELCRCLPIAYAACAEGFFRLAYADLIDSLESCRKRVPLFKDLRFSVDHVVALQDQKASFGEFVAHLLPAGGLDEINRTMSILINDDFLVRLRRCNVAKPGEPEQSLEQSGRFDHICESVTLLFQLRHIYAHELAGGVDPPIGELTLCTEAAAAFIGLSAVLVADLIEGPLPAA
jgi:hypothetical protein